MANLQVTEQGSRYAEKMDQALTDTVAKWWAGLSKNELLTYLAEQPSITADDIRDMLANVNCLMKFEVNFTVMNRDATADFHTSDC